MVRGMHGGRDGGVHGDGGACMVATGCAWWQGACVVAGGVCVGYDEIRSVSGRYASYWNAFLFNDRFACYVKMTLLSSQQCFHHIARAYYRSSFFASTQNWYQRLYYEK